MGSKRPSTRTLPSGEQVTHYPPDEEHPEGRMNLIRTGSPLREKLDARLESNQERLAELEQANADAVQAKKDIQDGKGMPPEKSIV